MPTVTCSAVTGHACIPAAWSTTRRLICLFLIGVAFGVAVFKLGADHTGQIFVGVGSFNSPELPGYIAVLDAESWVGRWLISECGTSIYGLLRFEIVAMVVVVAVVVELLMLLLLLLLVVGVGKQGVAPLRPSTNEEFF